MFINSMKYFLLILLSNPVFAQRGIDTSETMTIGGIKQYIVIKGKDVTKPLLLFLHGGPGGSMIQIAGKVSGELQQEFVVVHWDQRETGETQKLNKTTQPLALQMFDNDTHDLIDSLLRQFRRPKLYLVGYSWGSGLGFYIADNYPELLYAYIAVSPLINQWKSDSISFRMLKETMGKKAQEELSQVKIPFENADQLYYHRKWLFKHDGQKLVSLTLRKSFVQGWAATWLGVLLESCSINRFESSPAFRCPVYFFAGENDYQTNYSVTHDYYNVVSAPKKDLFLFSNAGHMLPETHGKKFQEIIIDKILPETFYY